MARTSFYTGPTIVGQIAGKFREAGFTVACEGTAHVYVEVRGDDPEERRKVLARLREVHGTNFGLE